MVVARKDDFCASIDRLSHRLTMAMTTRKRRIELQLRSLEARPGYAGFRGHLALRGRHAAELSHEMRRVMRATLSQRERVYNLLRLKLETFDLRRRLGHVRTRLVAAEGRLGSAAAKRVHEAEARLRAGAARLESLSPLAVLGRGYAVCWNADKTAIIRDASAVKAGDEIHVTLHQGELDARITNH
jgi:exodeoxyribonuclease VII large subunit